MGNKIVGTILVIITLLLGVLFLAQPKVQLAGDMPEYFGMTESLLSHANINLTSEDLVNLERNFVPEHFRYYILGLDGKRYPVHFILYSIIATPVRVVLHLFQANELKTLMLTNILLFSLVTAYTLKRFSLSGLQKGVLVLLLFLSPLAFFIAWPGPDIFYLSFFLIAIFLFYTKHYFGASLVAALASWHSQPIFIFSLGFLAMYLYDVMYIKATDGKKYMVIPFNMLWKSIVPLIIIGIPYVFNYLLFGVLTPWTLLQDGWTQVYGFGLQNASFKRIFEMFFDLNMGFFWYAPIILLGGGYYFLKSSIKDKRNIFVLGLIILTGLFYQTNPSWHFGTAGYGPSRHVLFVLPILIYFLVKFATARAGYLMLLVLIVVSQLFVLFLNGWFLPNWENTLNNSPVARFVLNRYPSLYTPTPEIFVDRTNHTDLGYITTAIYKDNGVCKKAYVLITEKDRLERECGSIPKQYIDKFYNDFLRKASYSRSVWTIEATFWPDTASCEEVYIPNNTHSFQCIKTLADVVKLTGAKDLGRFKQIGKGVWRMEAGLPVKVTVPPGYILQHYSFEGIYVNYD